jgi:hypothetical protein
LGLQPKGPTNPYSHSSSGLLAFQTPADLLQQQRAFQNPEPIRQESHNSSMSTQQTPKEPSAFGFVIGADKKQADHSISSINNVSKHSFEEVEKVETHYLRKPPGENFDS